ncbi:ATP-binding protein, partial [Candidatus Zixiibacteriota bacterium]
ILRGVISKIKVNQMSGLQYIEDLQVLPNASVDREYIEQILTNLIVNALQAMQQRGTLRVSTRVLENGLQAISSEGRSDRSPDLIEIEVADTGEGMSQEFIKHKLFKPFQTTKKKGLGIGLFQCREAVQAHGGRIEVQSESGQGTIFRIHLPVLQSPDDL